MTGLATVISTLEVSILSILLGLQPLPHDIPLFDLVRRNPVFVLGIGGFLVFVMSIALLLVHRPQILQPFLQRASANKASIGAPAQPSALIKTTSLATASTLSVIALLTVVLLRPSWCPHALCPVLLDQPEGTYDSSMVIAFSALQGSAFLIPGDPHTYSLGHLPDTQGPAATLVQNTVTNPANPYRVQIAIRNRRNTGYNIYIEGVAINIDATSSPSYPTRVWLRPGGDEDLRINPYFVTYTGQPVGSRIPATEAGHYPGSVRLSPLERDYITISINSTVPSALRLRVSIDYRITNEQQVHTLVLTRLLQVHFVNSRDLETYHLINGRLIPG